MVNQSYPTWTPYPNLNCVYGKEFLVAVNIPSSFASAVINGTLLFLLVFKVDFTERTIICLTIADFLTTAVSQPLLIVVYIFAVLNIRAYHKTSLYIQRIAFYFNCVTCSASVFSILLVIISRYIQIRFPLTHRDIITRSRLVFVCICIWIACLLFSLIAWFKGINQRVFYCFYLASVLVEFLIIIFICASLLKIASNIVRDISSAKAPTKATKTVTIIVCQFTLSIVPFSIVGLAYFSRWPSVGWTYVSDHDCTSYERRVHATLYFYSIFIVHLHSTFNPFVYSLRDARIKRALFRLFGRQRLNTTDVTIELQGTSR